MMNYCRKQLVSMWHIKHGTRQGGNVNATSLRLKKARGKMVTNRRISTKSCIKHAGLCIRSDPFVEAGGGERGGGVVGGGASSVVQIDVCWSLKAQGSFLPLGLSSVIWAGGHWLSERGGTTDIKPGHCLLSPPPPPSRTGARIYRHSSRRVARLQCGIYFKKGGIIRRVSHDREKMALSKCERGGFTAANHNGGDF